MVTTQEAQKDGAVQIIEGANRVRLEIEEFLEDNDMTNLYLHALAELELEKTTLTNGKDDWWTHYSMATIHGAPKEKWDGVDKYSSEPDQFGKPSGYCTHAMLTFPTWHRVYVGMYEQSLANKVSEIAGRWTKEPAKTAYKNAAERFRLPYWDPLKPRSRVNGVATRNGEVLNNAIWGAPTILTRPMVFVKRWDKDGPHEIENPLFRFQWPNQAIEGKGRTSMKGYVGGEKYTLRGPSLEAQVRSQGKSLGEKLWKLLAPHAESIVENGKLVDLDNEARDWNSFACHWRWDPIKGKSIKGASLPSAVSLESWHDEIHVLVGGGMGSTSTAAFDPVFWLHHNNIDRLFALYQALYPKKWIPSTGTQNGTQSLYPFRKGEGKYWISDQTRDWNKLGYDIPGAGKSDEARKADVEKYITEHYEWIAAGRMPSGLFAKKWPRELLKDSYALTGKDAPAPTPAVKSTVSHRAPAAIMQVASAELPALFNTFTLLPPEPEATETPTVKQLTWNARVSVLKFAFDGPFSVHLFIGKPDDSRPDTFIEQESEIGLSFIFASESDSPCVSCQKQADEGLEYEDAVPITHALYYYLREGNVRPEDSWPSADMRTLESFQPEHVAPFLKKYLRWRVIDRQNRIINEPERITASKLEVVVSTREFELPSSQNPLGLYGPASPYPDITAGKLGGAPAATPA